LEGGREGEDVWWTSNRKGLREIKKKVRKKKRVGGSRTPEKEGRDINFRVSKGCHLRIKRWGNS